MNEYLTLAAPFISAIVETWVKPKLKELYKSSEIDKNFYNTLDNKFEDYLDSSYRNNSIMNTIVFRNQQKLIQDLYIPLTLCKMTKGDSPEEILMDSYKEEFFNKYQRILITDTAGMGKSTVMKWLFLSCMENEGGIPLFVELRRISPDNGIIKEIYRQIDPIDSQLNKDYVLRLLARGDFVFFFDGYDEIPTDLKDTVTDEIKDFLSKTGNNIFIMSSREETSLMSFGDFQRFNIKQLTQDESFNLIRKYDNNGDLSSELITKIKTDNNLAVIKEFLTNPLMTALLYNAYDYKKKIPYKKHIFYSQVYDALFESHDLTKTGGEIHPKKSNLDIDDFERILRIVSYESFKGGIVSYNRDQIISLINLAKEKSSNLDFRPRDYLDDLIHAVPLFSFESNQYRWAHKSLQEYFAAKHICYDLKEKQAKTLLNIATSRRNSEYINVLDFCYDIDFPTFRQVVIKHIAKKYLEYREVSYNHEKFNGYNHKEIDSRKQRTFGYHYTFLPKNDKGEFKDEFLFEAADTFLDNGFKNVEFSFGNKYLFCLYAIDTLGVLIELLKNKQNALVKPISAVQSTFKLPRSTQKPPIFLDDSPDNILNNQKYFSDVTDLLKKHSIDYIDCIELIRNIEKEIEDSEKEEDTF